MDPIEELRRVVVQGFASVNDRFDALDAKLSGRIDALDAKLSARIDGAEGSLGGRIDALEAKMDLGFARVDETLAFVKRALLDHKAELRKKVDRDEVEAIVERAVARAIGS